MIIIVLIVIHQPGMCGHFGVILQTEASMVTFYVGEARTYVETATL